jgi:hypothetical protein
MPSSSKHLAINMGRYPFYNESSNEYSFTDEGLALAIHESNFDQFDFYYDLEELQEPPKMDNDIISKLLLPTLQKWSNFLWDAPTQCDEEIATAYSNLTAYETNLEAELDCTICNIQFWGEIDMPHQYSTRLIT